ncbi:histidine kinase dimerization/phospho-acceptor domain-containing protein [Streptomyces thermocarboxydus]
MERSGLPGDGVDAQVFTSDPEVGADLARVDWAATPLGAPREWPQSLQTAVSILLSSRFPMWMAWGEGLTFFCNAAYRRDTLGRKYPWALGRPASEVWAEIWGDIGPRIDAVLGTGRATWDEGLLLFLERSGYTEETYHTFSYSPLRDDAGHVVGMLCVVSEDTERVIGERRMATLRDLGSDPSVIRTEQEVLAFADRQLSRNPRDLPFTLTYLFDGDDARLVGATGVTPGPPLAPRPPRIQRRRPLARRRARRRGGAARPADRRPLRRPARRRPARAARGGARGPLLQQGSAPYGFLVAGLNRYRDLDDRYRGSSSWPPDTSPPASAAPAATRPSSGAPRNWPSWTGPRPRSSPTSATSCAPLTLIMGPVEELRTRLADAGEDIRTELDAIHRNGLRLGKLVNTLLDFSRIE